MKRKEIVALALGSNKGNRFNFIKSCLELLGTTPDTNFLESSEIYESPALGFESEDFLNMVVLFETSNSLNSFFKSTCEIEEKLGKTKRRNRNEAYQARTIDIDILYFGNSRINSKQLIIPHPEIHKRVFVSKPLEKLKNTLTSRGVIIEETLSSSNWESEINLRNDLTLELYQWIEQNFSLQNR